MASFISGTFCEKRVDDDEDEKTAPQTMSAMVANN
jgi:hypothetical protein